MFAAIEESKSSQDQVVWDIRSRSAANKSNRVINAWNFHNRNEFSSGSQAVRQGSTRVLARLATWLLVALITNAPLSPRSGCKVKERRGGSAWGGGVFRS